MATLLVWVAFLAALAGIVAAYVPAGARFGRVPWIAVALAAYFAAVLVGGGHLDLDVDL